MAVHLTYISFLESESCQQHQQHFLVTRWLDVDKYINKTNPRQTHTNLHYN